MTITDEVTFYWSQQIALGIADKTKILLESKHNLLDDTDTCLMNNWEVFCVQIQDKQLMQHWDDGIQVIQSFFLRYYDALVIDEQFTLWIQTDAGQAWYSHKDNKFSDTFFYDLAPRNFENCIPLLMTVLIEVATAFKNDNITNYIEYDCKGIDSDEDDYEEEEDEYDE
jgi:hypothetical protein